MCLKCDISMIYIIDFTSGRQTINLFTLDKFKFFRAFFYDKKYNHLPPNVNTVPASQGASPLNADGDDRDDQFDDELDELLSM